jgi:MFS family permease
MKGKNRRRIRRFFGISLAIVGVVFTLGGLIAGNYLQPLVIYIAESLQPKVPIPVWIWLTVFWLIIFVTLFIISEVLSYIYSKSLIPELDYFEELNFGKNDENTIRRAIDGILNTEKVEPFYVHAAPRSKEVETVYLRLKEIGFVMVSGGPGEGKSMVAYHAAYSFQEEDRYRVYALRVERLENKQGVKIVDEVLSQLDNLKGKRKLIIVDDAHKLAIKQDLPCVFG